LVALTARGPARSVWAVLNFAHRYYFWSPHHVEAGD
jgi:hypothetical protein